MLANEIVSSLYTEMGTPATPCTERDVALGLVLRVVREEDQAMCRDLHLAGELLPIREARIGFDTGTDTATLPVGPQDFGQAEFAEVELQSFGRRRVYLVDLKDLPSVSGSDVATDLNWTPQNRSGPERIALYRGEGGEIKARITPWPTEARTYVIYYSPGEVAAVRLDRTLVSLRALAPTWDILIARCLLRLVRYAINLPPDMREGIRRDTEARLENPVDGLKVQWHQLRVRATEDVDGFAGGFDLGSSIGFGG